MYPMGHIKKIFVLAVLATLWQHYVSAASASSDASVLSAETVHIPYIHLLQDPKTVIDGYFGDTRDDKSYEKHDLVTFATTEAQRLQLANIVAVSGLWSATVADPSRDAIKNNPDLEVKSPVFMDLRLELLRKSLHAPTPEEAVRQLTIDALRQRLKKKKKRILQSFFSPLNPAINRTKIEETVVWLIRATQNKIDIAMYFLTNKTIITELRNAMLRGVKIDIIINHDSDQTNLRASKLPYKIWQHPYKPSLLMHHKFALLQTIDGDSIVVNGSFNFTQKANSNHENIVVMNDRDSFELFSKQFVFAAKYAHPPVSLESSDAGPSSSQDLSEELDDSFIAPITSVTPYQDWLQAGEKLLKAMEAQREALNELDEIRLLDDSQLWQEPALKCSRND